MPLVDDPDETIVCDPACCTDCGADPPSRHPC